jgi:ABC-type Na+ efflux pump permease subunit
MAKNTMETPEQARSEQAHLTVAVSSGGAAAQHTLRNIRLIIGREYTYRVTQRSFIISSIILLVVVAIAAFIPTIVQFIASGTNSQTHIVVVNNAGTVAGRDETNLIAYINSVLNGTRSSGKAPYVITSESSTNLGDLQNQVKNGQLDILLVLDRVTNQNLRFTYDTDASATNDSNQSTIQALTQLLTFLDTAHRLGLTSQEAQRLAAPPDLIAVHTQQSQTTRPVSEIAAGFVLAYAGLAAMVSRQEEVQSAIMLPQLLMISGYLLFFLAVFTPDATLTKVLSYIPFWTPWVMLPRIARGTVAWWEIVVTIALMLVTILACTRFAARLYRYGVLMYGQRPSLRQLVKLVRTN